MEFEGNKHGESMCCILNGVAYSKNEEREAARTREMEDGEDKIYAIKHFEARTGRIFPAESCIELGLNLDTAFLSSAEIAKSAEYVLLNPRQSRRSILSIL